MALFTGKIKPLKSLNYTLQRVFICLSSSTCRWLHWQGWRQYYIEETYKESRFNK